MFPKSSCCSSIEKYWFFGKIVCPCCSDVETSKRLSLQGGTAPLYEHSTIGRGHPWISTEFPPRTHPSHRISHWHSYRHCGPKSPLGVLPRASAPALKELVQHTWPRLRFQLAAFLTKPNNLEVHGLDHAACRCCIVLPCGMFRPVGCFVQRCSVVTLRFDSWTNLAAVEFALKQPFQAWILPTKRWNVSRGNLSTWHPKYIPFSERQNKTKMTMTTWWSLNNLNISDVCLLFNNIHFSLC